VKDLAVARVSSSCQPTTNLLHMEVAVGSLPDISDAIMASGRNPYLQLSSAQYTLTTVSKIVN
jgi:hypothetical protein